jgi:hypothetical protein
MQTTGRIAVLMATFLFVAAALPVMAEPASTLQQLQKGEVLLDSQRRKHGGIVDARIFVPAPPRLVYSMLADPHQLPHYSPEVVSVAIIEDKGLQKRVRMRIRQWGLIDDESEVISTCRPYGSVTWQQVKGRFAVQEGAWTIGPMAQGTLLAYHLNIDVGATVPSLIVEAFLRSTVPALLRSVRGRFGNGAALPTLFTGLRV